MDRCEHRETELVQVPYKTSDGSRHAHIMKQCKLCGANVMGIGRWVSHNLLGGRKLQDLPLVKAPPGQDKQPFLFADEGGEDPAHA